MIFSKKFLLVVITLFIAGCSQEVNEGSVDSDNDTIVNVEQTETEFEGSVDEEEHLDEENAEIVEGNNMHEDETNEDNNNQGNLLSRDEAIIKVKEHLNIIFDEEVNIVIDREENGKFIIQVFDVVPGEGGISHTSTRGWYAVDRESGQVEDYL